MKALAWYESWWVNNNIFWWTLHVDKLLEWKKGGVVLWGPARQDQLHKRHFGAPVIIYIFSLQLLAFIFFMCEVVYLEKISGHLFSNVFENKFVASAPRAMAYRHSNGRKKGLFVLWSVHLSLLTSKRCDRHLSNKKNGNTSSSRVSLVSCCFHISRSLCIT